MNTIISFDQYNHRGSRHHFENLGSSNATPSCEENTSTFTFDNATATKGSEETLDGHYSWTIFLLFGIVIATLGGNVLVCLAVKREQKLRNMFNYFLVSLALSDMLCACLVMPVSIVKVKAFVDTPVPMMMCVAWYSLDVLFTSSTIIHLCMISIDRYMSFNYPLRYGHSKKTAHFVLKIALVWIISFCIAGPLFLLAMYDTQTTLSYKGCGPETPIFVISATVASFYLPLLIMAIMYVLTVRALHNQRRSHAKLGLNVSLSVSQDESSVFHRLGSWRSPSPSRRTSCGGDTNDETRPLQPYPTSDTNNIRLVRQPSYGLYVNNDPSSTGGFASSSNRSSNLQVPIASTSRNGRRFTELCPNPTPGSGARGGIRSNAGLGRQSSYREGGVGGGGGELIPMRDVKMEEITLCSGSKKYRIRTFHFKHHQPQRGGSRNSQTSNASSHHHRSSSSVRVPANYTDKGRRAVQVLGILFAVFVVFYLPFFATYTVKGSCIPCHPYISERMITAFEFLAYSGSMVNPIVYHVFNPDFRRAFHKLLRCRCRFAAFTPTCSL